MAIYGVAIEKQTLWHTGQEKFSNVYHYFQAANLSAAQADDLVDQITTAEKLIHTNEVTFLEGRVWKAGGTPAENVTITLRTLSGTGSLTNTTALFAEAAIVVRCDTTRLTSTGRKIYLRKYYHAQALPSADTAAARGKAVLISGNKTPFQTCLQSLREVTVTGAITVNLCAPGGELVSDTNAVTVLDYVSTRQFRR